jgi:ribosomal protein L27
MYAAHKAAGGMTSVYRQIGIGCEALFRRVLQDSLGLSAEAVRWSYEVPKASGGSRTLYLDGRVPVAGIKDKVARKRFHSWMARAAAGVGVDKKIFATLAGTVFEVRQGYKSKDSKRQNADIANAATAYTKAYLPCAVILSTQIDGDILLRYRAEKWAVVTGIVGAKDPLLSTYDFMKEVVGYDLAAFFERNRQKLKTEVDEVLHGLLAPETT